MRCEAALDDRIVLAGDWLAGGRVEGAWLSGAAAAAQLG
jgi:predicted NAD/FAD-dependent oxidoreductase